MHKVLLIVKPLETCGISAMHKVLGETGVSVNGDPVFNGSLCLIMCSVV